MSRVDIQDAEGIDTDGRESSLGTCEAASISRSGIRLLSGQCLKGIVAIVTIYKPRNARWLL